MFGEADLMHDEIWASVPSDRPLDKTLVDFALSTLSEAGSPAGQTRVLDLGCGDGRFTALLAGTGATVSGVDPSSVALERARAARPDVAFHLGLADGGLPFDDGSFDLVVCLDVLQHVADTQRLLSETRRVLAPRGVLGLSVPYHGRLKNVLIALGAFERHHDPLEPVLRFYTARSLRSLLTRLGFERIVTRGSGGAPLARRHLLALARRG